MRINFEMDGYVKTYESSLIFDNNNYNKSSHREITYL